MAISMAMAMAMAMCSSSALAMHFDCYSHSYFDSVEEVLVEPGTVPKTNCRVRRAKPLADTSTDLILFPNPASDYLVVRSSCTGQDFSILATDGKVLAQGMIEPERAVTVIDISHLPSGAYSLIIAGHSSSFQVLR